MSTLVLILGNQLFDPSEIQKRISNLDTVQVFMREDAELCTYYKFHKHKLIFFLSAMRAYCQELKNLSVLVHYEAIDADQEQSCGGDHATYEQRLVQHIKENQILKICLFEIEDKFFEKRILSALKSKGVEIEIWPSPMFLTSRREFRSYLQSSARPFMKVFYEKQRVRLNILVDEKRAPLGGQWSFDAENRQPLPAKINPPSVPKIALSSHDTQVMKIVDQRFPDHPGEIHHFWLPTTRAGAKQWLDRFLHERLASFGPYEDAIPTHSDFLFHSVLTPFLNTGLLSPHEVIEMARAHARVHPIELPSLEGFVRQIIGWREFVRGIYQNYSEKQETSNFFNHERRLTQHWYDGTTGIRPLDQVILKAVRFGYSHHIERLMVVGSLMLLLEIKPEEAHRWFMEMYIDSSDWVMGPNVYGMALFSDGGIFATKPYICGSNYYRKMGPYKANESWCDAVDGLYWSFIEKNKAFFSKNHRTMMMVKTVDKMEPLKKARIYAAAEKIKEHITHL